jgi:predicted GNAT family acetyltransferase
MQIEHIPEHHRFVVRLPGGDAVLAYRNTPAGPMDIRKVYVPEPAREQGVGGALVEAALIHARREGRLVIPTCWYVGTWVSKHAEFRDLLIGDQRDAAPAAG